MLSTLVMRPCMMRKCGLLTFSCTERKKSCTRLFCTVLPLIMYLLRPPMTTCNATMLSCVTCVLYVLCLNGGCDYYVRYLVQLMCYVCHVCVSVIVVVVLLLYSSDILCCFFSGVIQICCSKVQWKILKTDPISFPICPDTPHLKSPKISKRRNRLLQNLSAKRTNE